MPISQIEINDWKSSEVTRAFCQALDERISDLLKEALTWSEEDLKFKQGYLRALVDISPKEFTVEGFE